MLPSCRDAGGLAVDCQLDVVDVQLHLIKIVSYVAVQEGGRETRFVSQSTNYRVVSYVVGKRRSQSYIGSTYVPHLRICMLRRLSQSEVRSLLPRKTTHNISPHDDCVLERGVCVFRVLFVVFCGFP